MIAPTSFFADYGCHVRILEEAQVLQNLGHRVIIATYRNGGPVPGLDIRRTLPVPWRRDYEVGSSRHKIAFDALLGIKTLQLMLREPFDIIHAHLHEGALIGLVLGRLFRKPVVFDFQGSMTAEMLDHHFLSKQGWRYRLLRKLEMWIDRGVPLIFTSSAHARHLLINEFACDPGKVRSLPDAVNAEMFRPATSYNAAELDELRDQLGIPKGRRLIVYLGLLAEYQGTGLLLQALRHIISQRQDVHLLLMGFPNEEFYRQRAVDQGIAEFVTFTGRVPYHSAPQLLALGDVAVSAKLSLTEGAGKLLNYMSLGLPTVAFDTPVAREYLGTDGALAHPGDPVSLAENLLAYLFPTSNAGWSAGQRLRQRAMSQFGWNKAGLDISTAYESLFVSQAPHSVTAQQR